jgi:hypothetical protein
MDRTRILRRALGVWNLKKETHGATKRKMINLVTGKYQEERKTSKKSKRKGCGKREKISYSTCIDPYRTKTVL